MSALLLLSLAALALIDSTSIGTLIVPVLLLLSAERSMPRRVLVYLATVAVFYFGVGVALLLGLTPALAALDALDARIFYWAELVAGVVLFLLSFWFDPKRMAARGKTGRSSWARDRVARMRASDAGMVLLGLTAAGIEAATMLPYLAALGLIAGAEVSPAGWLPTLAAYNAVMVLPALVLLGVRIAAGERLTRPLERLAAWFSKHSASALSWTLGIIGFLLARDAVVRLFFPAG
ncbi:hypothetical protein Misp01_18440 [Microtetraspora sp. NBRC 13810]|uniref:GAP family protein n=1 Tax=Microtetraspora sp. NBRC 13810 TaxID=3030990 RepID=UPI0024A0D60A|nr:GAP family protein [Microtetraspora sp. NBRC 13810]GLW06714.1 hypothetical protein Misp01_18440 [Microtetraspora sp. NBRC 13810]